MPMTRIENLEKQIASLYKELEKERKNATGIQSDFSQNENVQVNGGLKGIDVPCSNELAQSRLWSRISHEILTPMDAILGMTDLVMDTDLTDEQRNYLEMINASADRLFGVISDIIDYSELVEGKLRRDMKNFDLFKVLEYDLYIAKLTARHKDLAFRYTFARDIPNYIHSDSARLRQVLNNLISNSIKFTHEGEVSVNIEKVGYDDNRRPLLRFTVKDSGVGISPEKQETIFQIPTSPGYPAVEEKYSEGGLGLVLSAKLVEMFGGKIMLQSNPGEGSAFSFTWPVADPVEMYMGELPPDMFSERQDRSQALNGANILLAEDEFINASITKAYLEQLGAVVTVVTNGREAVVALDKDTYQAVLMDVQMPVMDGLQATQNIRKREKEKGSRCPIIALTAHAMHGDRERCLQAGMDDYLTKPLDKDLLIDMLVRYVTKRALIIGSNPEIQQDVIQPLVETGWAVTIAETGRLARYEASLVHYDLIVIDASLSFEDGEETVNTIRKIEEFSGCRSTVIGVGFADKAACDKYQHCDIDEFFTLSTDLDFGKRLAELGS